MHHEDSPPHLKYFSTLPCETLKITIAADFSGIGLLHAGHHETSKFILQDMTLPE